MVVVACTGDEPQPTVECGAGTTLVDGVCETSGPTCGAATIEVNGVCVPTIRFELRAPANVRADGYSPTEVLVFATAPDGSAAAEHVVITSSRNNSGSFVSPSLVLDSLGGATNFIPCNAQEPGCPGPVTFSLALASAPTVSLTSIDVTLVAPPAVGSMQQCQGPGNTLYVDGTNYHYNSPVTAPAGYWDVFGDVNRSEVHLVPNDLSNAWVLSLNTIRMHMPMIPTVYDDLALATSGPDGTPGLYLSVPNPTASSCEPHGSFQIHAFTVDTITDPQTPRITRLAASFVLTCPLEPTRHLSGCVSFTQ